MKKIPKRLKLIIDKMFFTGQEIQLRPSPSFINYDLNNVFSNFLRVKTSSSGFEIPIFCNSFIETTIVRQFALNGEFNDIIIPLGVNKRTSTVKSIDKLFYPIDYSVTKASGFSSYKTEKSDVYHIERGIIMDKDDNLLMFNTIEIEVKDGKLEYKKVKSYIHPSVFYSDGLIEKTIVEKIIPYILKEGIYVYPNHQNNDFVVNDLGIHRIVNSQSYYRERVKPEIVVKDVKDIFFCTPNAPSSNFDEEINDLLVEDINTVVDIFKQ